jgi:hypothetical protein
VRGLCEGSAFAGACPPQSLSRACPPFLPLGGSPLLSVYPERSEGRRSWTLSSPAKKPRPKPGFSRGVQNRTPHEAFLAFAVDLNSEPLNVNLAGSNTVERVCHTLFWAARWLNPSHGYTNVYSAIGCGSPNQPGWANKVGQRKYWDYRKNLVLIVASETLEVYIGSRACRFRQMR